MNKAIYFRFRTQLWNPLLSDQWDIFINGNIICNFFLNNLSGQISHFWITSENRVKREMQLTEDLGNYFLFYYKIILKYTYVYGFHKYLKEGKDPAMTEPRLFY